MGGWKSFPGGAATYQGLRAIPRAQVKCQGGGAAQGCGTCLLLQLSPDHGPKSEDPIAGPATEETCDGGGDGEVMMVIVMMIMVVMMMVMVVIVMMVMSGREA